MRQVFLLVALAVSSATATAGNCTHLRSQAEVDAFDCPSVRWLVIEGAGIVDLSPLSVLHTIEDFLIIRHNPLLTSLEGLGGLEQVYLEPFPGGGGLGSISIIDNASLVSLAGMSSLSAAGDVRIASNPSLTDLAGFRNLNVLGQVAVDENAALTDLNGFETLRSVRTLILKNNDNLRNLSHLSELSSLSNLVVENNDALSTLTGLGPLASIAGTLSITDNDELTDPDALYALAHVGGDLEVTGNLRLADCTIGFGPLLSAQEEDPDVVGGTVTFSDNAANGGCNSIADVLAGYNPLGSEGADATIGGPLTAYPNPAAAPATLAFALAAPVESTLVVYDALGREVARPVDGPASGEVTATLPALPAGLYVARLTTGDGREETVRLTVLR